MKISQAQVKEYRTMARFKQKMSSSREKNMALVVEGTNIGGEFRSIPFSDILPSEVLIRTIFVGLCTTDREIFNGTLRRFSAGKNHLLPGHETVGQVIKKGCRADGINIGDFVVPTVRRGCGECANCAENKSDFCSTGKFTERGIIKEDGFMCSYFKEKPENLVIIPPELYEYAIFLEPMSIVQKAFSEAVNAQKNRISTNSAENKVFKKCLIAGCGTIGLMTAYYMNIRQIPFTGIDVASDSSLKAKQIRSLGGKYIAIPQHEDSGKSANLNINEKFDIIIEAAGTASLSFALLDKLLPNGILVLLGLPGEEKELTIPGNRLCNNFVMNNNMIIGAVNANRNHFIQALELLQKISEQHGSSFINLITHRFPFQQFKAALKVSGEERVKVILEMQEAKAAVSG